MEILALDMSWFLEKGLHILWVALGLGLVIFFHELGHFAVAKWCGVFVERFSIGFGPILFSFKRGETEYALSAVPFGGYVKMLGQDDMDPSQLSSEEIAQDPRSYSAKSVPQRMAIISAGVIMNIITGLCFFAIAFKSGIDFSPPIVGNLITGRPAWEHGIEAGDRITRINGRDVDVFQDIMRGTALSRGAIEIEGVHRDGRTFSMTITPERDDLRRLIGVSPVRDLKVGSLDPKDNWTARAGSPAAAAKFEKDDVILEVGGQPMKDYIELEETLARRRSEKLDFIVDRQGQKVTLSVEPWKFREMGLWMDIEQIASIRQGSPAEKAGLKVGDKITQVNGADVGKKINPLHLAEYFESLAGQEVELRVKRTVDGSPEPQLVTLKLTPADTPPWIEPPISEGAPLSIPSIGAAYHLTSNILNVVPGSPAEKAGIPRGAALKSMTITSGDEKLSKLDGGQPLTIKFDDASRKNVAFALWQQQVIPLPKVTLTIQAEGKQFTLEPAPAAEDWYLPERGLFLIGRAEPVKADDWGGAFGMAFKHTRNSALDNYLTIRNLIFRDLSVKNLHGPIGIFQVAFEVSQQGVPRLLMFLGFLSVNLAVLNFLPIPVLDGGHMVFLIWEGVTRKKPSERVLNFAHLCGLAFVVGLMLFVICLDIFVHRFKV